VQIEGEWDGRAADGQWNRNVPDVLAVAIGMARPEVHRHGGEDVGHGRDQTDLHDGQRHTEGLPEAGNDRGQEETECVQAVGDTEIDDRQRPDPRTRQSTTQRKVEPVSDLSLFGGECVDQPLAFIGCEPVCVGRGVGEIKPADHAEDYRG